MGKLWRAPGTCTDCGNDAYIHMGAQNGGDEMLCAHCYAARLGRVQREAPARVPSTPSRPTPPPRRT